MCEQVHDHGRRVLEFGAAHSSAESANAPSMCPNQSLAASLFVVISIVCDNKLMKERTSSLEYARSAVEKWRNSISSAMVCRFMSIIQFHSSWALLIRWRWPLCGLSNNVGVWPPPTCIWPRCFLLHYTFSHVLFAVACFMNYEV